MDYLVMKLIWVSNVMNFIYSWEYILYLSLLLITYMFLLAQTTFFRVLLSILFIVFISILLARAELDFFSGFLLVAELPILVISLLFYFHKYSLQFDNLYFVSSANKFFKFFFIIFSIGGIGLYLWFREYYKQGLNNIFFEKSYDYTITFDLFLTSRNDLMNYYTFFYVTDSYSTLAIAVLIFIISYLVILFYYAAKLSKVAQKSKKENILFLRKQNLFRQAVYNNKLRFFNKKISKKQHEHNKVSFAKQEEIKKKAAAILKKKV